LLAAGGLGGASLKTKKSLMRESIAPAQGSV